MKLESTLQIMEQLQHLGNLKSRIYITDLPKIQSKPYTADLSSHPQQRGHLLC